MPGIAPNRTQATNGIIKIRLMFSPTSDKERQSLMSKFWQRPTSAVACSETHKNESPRLRHYHPASAGWERTPKDEPFQRLFGRTKTVETVWLTFLATHRAEARC